MLNKSTSQKYTSSNEIIEWGCTVHYIIIIAIAVPLHNEKFNTIGNIIGLRN
jgi:hypothetical protein